MNPLYPWSPKRLRAEILRDGLKIMSPSRYFAEGGKQDEVAFPWVCLGTTPSTAWGLLPDPEVEHPDHGGCGWDLWQVQVADGDRLAIRGGFAPYVREVRVHNSLPAERIWWVAEREGEPHETLEK